MALQTQESPATLPSQLIAQVADDLLNGGESEPCQHTHSQPNALSAERQQQLAEHSVRDDEPQSLPATVPESVQYPSSPSSTPLNAKITPRLPTIQSAPADMESMVRSTPSQDALKAATFHGNIHPDGDTQPMPSQIYHERRESMQRRSMAEANGETPMKPRMMMEDTDPSTVQSVRSAMTATPHTLQQDQSGYVDLAVGYQESSPVHSTQGDEGFDEFLQDPSSPQTQFQVPGKPNPPETPSLAGHKHSQDGELHTSVTTARTNTTSWGFSQAFGQQKADLMARSQLFAYTQAASSPVPDGPRSDPIQSRPSPNIKERDDFSSPLGQSNSSPAFTRNTPLVRVPGDPRPRYRTMAEEFKDRMSARAVSEQLEPSADPDEDEFFDDDSYQERIRLKSLRRSLSDQAMVSAARVKAPARPGSRQSLKASSRPSSSRKEREVIDIVTPGPAAHRSGNDNDEFLDMDQDDDEVGEEEPDESEEDLPGRLILEDDYEEQGDQIVENETDIETAADGGVDEYDELYQGLRSQANDPDDHDKARSIADSVEQPDVEMQTEEDREEDGGAPPDSRQGMHQSTQRSTAIADSQPNAAADHNRLLSVQQVQQSSLASFVPGSQYAGRTSAEQAFLPSSQRRSQSRVPASQQQATDSGALENSLSGPSAHDAGYRLGDSTAAASLSRRSIVQQCSPSSPPPHERSPILEIPESDLPDPELEERQGSAFQSADVDGEMHESNPGPPFSTARIHVSGSAQSPAKSALGPDSPMKLLNSQNSRRFEMSPRKAAGVRRFAEMATGLTPSNGSFETVDVDDVMNGIMTDEDRKIVALGESAIEPPRPKRRKVTRNGSSLSENPFSRPYVETGNASQEIVPSEAEAMTAVPDASLVDSAGPTQALKDSPSKGNELAHPSIEETKSQEPTSDNTLSREKQGASAVSQLIATRSTGAARKAKPSTYGNKSKRKSTTRSNTRVGRKGARTKPADAADRVSDGEGAEITIPEPADYVMEDPSNSAIQNGIVSTDTEMATATAVDQDAVLETFTEQPDNGDASDAQGYEDPVVAPERIFALFKGTYHNFYPATWLGGSADGMTYKVRFDDTTVTNIETFHVSCLDLRVGDLVKVDVAGMKTKTWRIVGFASPAQTAEERAQGADTRGHTRLKVRPKTSRNSLAKDESHNTTQDEGQIEEVSVSQVYLTKTMWPSFQVRTFKQPSKAKYSFERADTPSTRPGTPTIETPSSRSRRANMPLAKTKALNSRPSHLRDISVASSNSSNLSAIFSGMAFAISYLADEDQKAEVTRLICRHGGIILDDGFEELFELPNIGATSGYSPKKRSPAKCGNEQKMIEGLRLKADCKQLTVVALIADRHSRRAKYMQALALGLPTLSGRWIIDSLDTAKNSSLANGEVAPLSWDRYLLPAGESSYLGGAVRSRTLAPYEAKASELVNTIAVRPVLLKDESVLIVAPKKGKASWDKRKTHAFLTLALGAAQVKRVNDLQEAKALMQGDTEAPKWVYVDGGVSEACTVLFDKAPANKKRKRDGDAVVGDTGNMSVTHGNVRVANDEFVIQSLILGALIE